LKITMENRRPDSKCRTSRNCRKGPVVGLPLLSARNQRVHPIEVGYTLLPVYSLDYRPVTLERQLFNLDPYIIRLIVLPCADLNDFGAAG
jgi:hypothetical protein